MIKIIVDSNILFSALLNINSKIAGIIINGQEYYDFYAPQYARLEILKHQNKIKKIAQLNDEEFLEVYQLIFGYITVLNHSILPQKDLKKAIEYCEDIDIDDSVFVGFSEYLKSKLWTGDKKLINGLVKKQFKKIITTEDLFKDFIEKNNRIS